MWRACLKGFIALPKAAPGISTPEINTGSLHRLFRLTGNRLLRGGNKRKKKETLLPSSFLPPILQLNNNKASSFAAHRIKILLLSFLEEKFSFDRDVKTVADSFPTSTPKTNLSRAKRGDINTRRVREWLVHTRNEHGAIFLSLNDQGGRYLEASNMPGRGNRSTSGRLFGDRERHYHEYKHPTTAILMVVRS